MRCLRIYQHHFQNSFKKFIMPTIGTEHLMLFKKLKKMAQVRHQ